MSKHDNKNTGAMGERLAVRYLKGKGYGIIELNYITEVGEIDIIAHDGETLVFVEVKTRESEDFGLPANAVDYRKQRKISAVASQYVKKNMLFGASTRFDVIDILLSGNKITHYEDAFDSYLKY